LTEFLLAKGYKFTGSRACISFNTERIDHVFRDFHEADNRFFLHYADLTDGSSLASLLHAFLQTRFTTLVRKPCEGELRVPEFTTDVVATGTLRLLEAMRLTGVKCRFYQASVE